MALGFALGLWFRFRSQLTVRPSIWLLLVLLGALSAQLSQWLTHWVWAVVNIDLASIHSNAATSLAVHLALVAPAFEGLKLLALAGLVWRGRILSSWGAVVASVLMSAGYACVDVWMRPELYADNIWLRGALAELGQLVFSCAWAFVLASPLRYTWLRAVWLSSTALHGLYLHIVTHSGPGTLAAALPLLATSLGLLYLSRRRLLQFARQDREGVEHADGPSAELLLALVRARRRRLPLHWILFGAFVTTGVVLVSVAGAVVLGYQLGIDFALADEDTLLANGPLALIGMATVLAFPVSAFLVARASGTHSVIEPALGAALALAFVVALLSFTAPATLVFVVAVAPLAFALACVGAWFGLSRS